MQCVSFLSLFCHFFGVPSIFLGQAWADGKGKRATCHHHVDSGGETVKNVCHYSLDRLHASMIKQKKNYDVGYQIDCQIYLVTQNLRCVF